MICTPNTGHPVLGVQIRYTAQEMGRFFFCAAASAFYLLCPCVCRQFRSTLFCPHRRSFLPAVFVPVGPPGFPENGRSFCRKVVLCPEKSTGRLLRPFIPPFLTDFTMFFAKKALQMNFKNILYNYRFNFFTQIVSYRFVWGSRVCAFCTASALR